MSDMRLTDGLHCEVSGLWLVAKHSKTSFALAGFICCLHAQKVASALIP